MISLCLIWGASVLFWWLKKGKDEDKAEEQWKTIWVVVLKVTVLVLLFGLTASVAVFILKYNHGEDQTQRKVKDVFNCRLHLVSWAVNGPRHQVFQVQSV